MTNDLAYEYKDYDTTYELWKSLNEKFAGTTVAKLRQLTINFDTYKMPPVMPKKYPRIFIIILLNIPGINRTKLGFFQEFVKC